MTGLALPVLLNQVARVLDVREVGDFDFPVGFAGGADLECAVAGETVHEGLLDFDGAHVVVKDFSAGFGEPAQLHHGFAVGDGEGGAAGVEPPDHEIEEEEKENSGDDEEDVLMHAVVPGGNERGYGDAGDKKRPPETQRLGAHGRRSGVKDFLGA